MSSFNLKQKFRENRGFLILIFTIVLVRSSIMNQYVVPSGSMIPTIHIGDRILVNRISYDFKWPWTNSIVSKFDEPKRGDIIVFENPRDGVVMIKRLIGLPGDHLQVKNGFYRINGEFISGSETGIGNLDMAFSSKSTDVLGYIESMDTLKYNVQRMPWRVLPQELDIRIPEGQFFFSGDNRDNSLDSRSWGLVPREKLIGRAFRISFSANILAWPPTVDLGRFGRSLYEL